MILMVDKKLHWSKQHPELWEIRLKKMLKARENIIPWNAGKKMPIYHRQKLSEIKTRLHKDGKLTHVGFSKTRGYNREKTQFKVGHKHTKENLKKILKNRKTENETKLEFLLNDNGFNYKFVGDGAVIIENKCPDFINCNGQKKIIEFIGGGLKSEMDSKIEIYKKYGYKTLVLYLPQLRNNPQAIIKKVRGFDNE